MQHSEQVGDVFGAFAKAQAQFTKVPKTKTAKVKGRTKGGSDYEYTYKYADLADCLSMALPILSSNGLALAQPNTLIEGKLRVITMLLHSSGQWIASDGIELSEAGDPQQFGIESMYFRRYDACSFLGIAPDEDTDAQQAGPRKPAGPQTSQPMSAAPKAPAVPKVNHEPAKGKNEPRPGSDRTLVEVVLDKPVAPVETVQKMDEKPKKLTAKEKTEVALEAEHKDMIAAIDERIAENRDPDYRLPNDEERKDNSARVRKLIALGLSASEKTKLQAYVEGGKPLAEKLQTDWKKVLTQLEAAGTKEAVLQIINPTTEAEEF